MELDRISNLELLDVYKEANNFCDFLEKLLEQTKKEIEANDE